MPTDLPAPIRALVQGPAYTESQLAWRDGVIATLRAITETFADRGCSCGTRCHEWADQIEKEGQG